MKQQLKNKQVELILMGCVMLVVILFLIKYENFASRKDWLSQHSVLPDYFRQRFYETGNLFTTFAPQLGGGENVFYFSYYGLYSPLILPSLLLPFLSMETYLMVAGVGCILAAVLLLYRWLQKKGMGWRLSALMALFYLLAAPVVYQSYTQWMFVNYMPFLILALMGVDRYLDQRKSGLLVLSVWLMIMTSFYFSIGGMLALCLYELAMYVRQQDKIRIGALIMAQLKMGLHLLLSVGMSMILLLPTVYSLMGRNSSASGNVSLVSLLCPQFSWQRLVYHPYGMGLTTLFVTCLIIGLFDRKAWERILSYGMVMILCIPVFGLLLNGGLYIRDKAFIPFIPLGLYWMACCLQKVDRQEISRRVGMTAFGLTMVLTLVFRKSCSIQIEYIVRLVDVIVMIICYLIDRKRKRLRFVPVAALVFMCLQCFAIQYYGADAVSKDLMNSVKGEEIKETAAQLTKNNPAGYRLERDEDWTENTALFNRIYNQRQFITTVYSSAYNESYVQFRERFGLDQPNRNILMHGVSSNPVFRKLMGIRFVLSAQQQFGMKEQSQNKGERIYENEVVAPAGFVTDRLLSISEYGKLKFPYSQLALTQYVVSEQGKTDGPDAAQVQAQLQNTTQTVACSLPLTTTDQFSIQQIENGYDIHAAKSRTVSVPLPEPAKKKQILFVRFQVKNQHPENDMQIIVNGVKNKLTSTEAIYYNENTTFTYASYLETGADSYDVRFVKGDYEISDLECYIASVDEETEAKMYEQSCVIDDNWSKGDSFEGTIETGGDGLYVTSIPYDQGFRILVDGRETKVERVNTAFVGFAISEGKHQIQMEYEAPGSRMGRAISAVLIFSWVLGSGIAFYRRRKGRVF